MRRALATVLAVLLLGCGGGAPRGAAVRIVLNWFPEHEHGGYLAAVAEGLYREAGVDVQILPGGPGAAVVPRVASGEVDFGVGNADDVVQGRAAGAPVVALMAPIQHSPFCVMVHARSGIARLTELRDLTLAMTPGTPYLAWLEHVAPLSGVRIVPYGGSVAEFLVAERYAQQAYLFSEPVLAADRGGDPRCLPLSAVGFDPYTSVLIASERLVREQPALVRAVVAASVRGWARYLENPAPVNAYILRLNPEVGPRTLAEGEKLLAPLVLDDVARREGIGAMTRERWATLAEQMRTIGSIEAPVAPEGLFDARFLPAR
ncbi:MAG TPA: ABC transporter substrate-binding protein [Candidatus Binatia bacterium]|nr:ABC transporter substrate-binding protein [Candidatus Binatia bacterium]